MDNMTLVEALNLLDEDDLVWVLGQLELAERRQVELAVRAALAAESAPLAILEAASRALAAWAGDDELRMIYAGEVDDITRRVAGDIATS
jgi:hypothetical protein